MRPFYVAVAMLTCVAFAVPTTADEKSSEAVKPRNYAEAAEECEKAIARRKHELANEYSSDVWGLKQKFQKDGNLEHAIVADTEWSRSLSRKPLSQEQLVESPPELTKLQREYLDRFARLPEAVATEFLQDLKKEASELAKAGRLADGKVLQQEIDTIKRLYLDPGDGKTRGSDVAKGKVEDDVVSACEEAIRQKRVAMQAQYAGELEALEKASQAKGALEDMFAVKAERQRYLETPILAESNLVETPSSLRELQDKYLEWQEGLAAKVVEEFVARLEQQKQSLTIEGKLEEAVKAKEAVEKVRQKLLVSSNDRNRQVLKRFIGKYRFENGNIEEIAPNGVYLVNGSASHEWGGRWELDSTNPKRPCVTRYANNGTVTHWYIHPQLPHTLVSEKGGTITRISVPPSVRSR